MTKPYCVITVFDDEILGREVGVYTVPADGEQDAINQVVAYLGETPPEIYSAPLVTGPKVMRVRTIMVFENEVRDGTGKR